VEEFEVATGERRSVLRLEDQVPGMKVEEAKRLKALEQENIKLKRLLAESMLDMNR
jgi:putative transposase